MYRDGYGVAQDNVQAYAWLKVSIASGNAKDRGLDVRARDRVAEQMTPKQIAKAEKLALNYYKKIKTS
jgi:TPR repeat protein